ncbi:hypothetical protein OFN97_02665 [Campylobacter sp. VBCF_05 NA6]|uniref:hypothetical protein n=1 Tax=unclassified Campylobacter TaxID=2593542 RepID=UPI0022EA0ECF|nr:MULTISPECIES: hypothetical protein [unclassified Campylobacter]MDA3058378.1 hypothetical protein [Campylobacter sp. VBCF_04 NA7]MDA3058919.1 hypothetical protein [Campylobacter sp. VBCF_05 NA6]
MKNWNKKKFDKNLNTNSNRNQRDYDKEPLVLRDYSGFPFIFHHLGILIFWISASSFCISFLDDFESGILDINQISQTLINFTCLAIGFVIIDYFNIIKSKKKYITYYASKVAYCNEKFKEISTEDLRHNGIVVRAVWFLNTIFTTTFGKMILAIFLIANFIKGTFETAFIGVLLLIFILLVAEFLEILVFMGIYKKSNKSLKNFWQIFLKFQLNIEYAQEIHWYDSREFDNAGLYSIHLFCFNENDYKQVRDYIMAIFHIDINKNLSEQQFQKFFQ